MRTVDEPNTCGTSASPKSQSTTLRAFTIIQKDLLELFDYIEPAEPTSGATPTASTSFS
jgi:hypothetical protein